MNQHYIYAVLRREDARTVALPPVAEPTEHVSCHIVGDIAVVVSPTTQTEILSTRRNMLSHTKILEELVRDLPILPFRFGVVAAGLDRIEAILGPRSDELRGMIDQIADSVEVGLRVEFQEQAIFQQIVSENPVLRRRSEQLKGRPQSEVYYEQIELGRQVEERLAAMRADLADRLSTRLAPLVEQMIRHKTSEDMAVLNAALLVRRAQESALFAELQKVEAEVGDTIALKYLSPVPPYNFVSVRLDARAA
jgi:hypothetical protein